MLNGTVQGRPPYSGVIAASTPGGRPVNWAATGRWGGHSGAPFASLNLASHVGDEPASVGLNRALVGDLVGARGIAVTGAVHGASWAIAPGPGEIAGIDAVISQTPGLGVMALGADCLVLGIIGDDDLTVAAVHCGWRGLVADVTGATLSALSGLGVQAQQVILGPSVCGSCYPVPSERSAEVRAACSDAVADAALVRCPDGQPGIDVRRGVRARLAELGIDAITSLDACTAESPALFSHRRDGVTGRQGLVLVRGLA